MSRQTGLIAHDLGVFLDRLHLGYHKRDYLSSDPLEFVHRYTDPWDQEAIALVSALLAYGNVKQIRRSLEELFRRIETVARSPSEFVRGLSEGGSRFESQAQDAFRGFVHRFNRGEDMLLLFQLLSRSWKSYGSLGAHFLSHLDSNAETTAEALDHLIHDWRSWASKFQKAQSFDYLLTAPKDGSCCKRWCMFLRWMGRRDELDPGLWTETSPLKRTFPSGRSLKARQLVIPLDTHTGRISQYLGLTRRKSLDWKAALEVTENLSLHYPEDPTRYDFAISRLGILDLCQRRYRPEICERCELVSVCKFAKKKSRTRAKLRS